MGAKNSITSSLLRYQDFVAHMIERILLDKLLRKQPDNPDRTGDVALDGFAMLRVLSDASEAANTTTVAVTGWDVAAVNARGGLPVGIEILPKTIPFGRLIAIATAIVAQSGSRLVAA